MLYTNLRAVIGKNITVVGGQIEGSDNLLIEGVVESKINLDAKLVVALMASFWRVRPSSPGSRKLLMEISQSPKIATLSTASQVVAC